MEDFGIFSARHPLTLAERARVNFVNPQLRGPQLIYGEDINNLPSQTLFQHIDCGAVYRIRELIQFRRIIKHVQGENAELKCYCATCKDKTSIVKQLKDMGYIASEDELTWRDRHALLRRAMVGFPNPDLPGQHKPANLALKNMLLRPEFARMVYKQPGQSLSLLEKAIYSGDEVTVLLLIHWGAHPAASSYLGMTPLHFAVKYKKPWAVRVLLEHGANPLAVNDRGYTALQWCAILFHQSNDLNERQVFVEIGRILLQTHPVFDHVRDAFEEEKGFMGRTQLHEAVFQLNENGVRVLLAAQTNPNLQDNQGFRPLDILAARNACFDDGRNPAFVGVARLLAERAILYPEYFVAAVMNFKPRLCVELLRAARNRAQNLREFAEYCQVQVIAKITELNFLHMRLFLVCLKELPEFNHLSLLHIAVSVLPENKKTRKFLKNLIYRRDFYAMQRPSKEANPMDDAFEDRTYVVSRCDVNAQDSQREESALFLAIAANKLSFVKVLADQGADFTIADIDGNFPFDEAVELGDEEMLELVRNWSLQFVVEGVANNNEQELAIRLGIMEREELDEEEVELIEEYRREEGIGPMDEDEEEAMSMEMSSDEENDENDENEENSDSDSGLEPAVHRMRR